MVKLSIKVLIVLVLILGVVAMATPSGATGAMPRTVKMVAGYMPAPYGCEYAASVRTATGSYLVHVDISEHACTDPGWTWWGGSVNPGWFKNSIPVMHWSTFDVSNASVDSGTIYPPPFVNSMWGSGLVHCHTGHGMIADFDFYSRSVRVVHRQIRFICGGVSLG